MIVYTPRVVVYDVATTTRFRGLARRQGVLIRGAAGWGEWSPFPEYATDEAAWWWAAAREAAEEGYPTPVRDAVEVNCTIPAVSAADAHARTLASGCRTAKVKVAERGQSLADDLARVEAVRDALGASGQVRIDANGAWTVDEALVALRQLDRVGALEYAEQPCATTEDLADLRRRLARGGHALRIAADESIRRSGDPQRVVELEAADIAVLKVQPLGGVRRCLRLAEQLGLPVVVSSALETSIGIRMGVALAAALPELPFACGLNTVPLLAADVTANPLVAVAGRLPVREVTVDERPDWRADAPTAAWWQARLEQVQARTGDLR